MQSGSHWGRGSWITLHSSLRRRPQASTRLLRAGANANAKDYDDRTALHVACSEGNVSAVEVLIVEGNADASLRDRWGLTPLEEASRVGARAVMMFLEAHAEAGAEQEEEDSSQEARKDR